MSALDEFKDKIRSGEMFDAMAVAMGEAVELNITTWIAPAEEDDSELDSQPGHRMRTRINLIDGEIDNEIGREFANNPGYEQLQKLHLQQVKRGREILLNNLASLQSMFAMLEETQTAMSEVNASVETQALPEAKSTDLEADVSVESATGISESDIAEY